ncbi:hypothetical protein HID58_057615 [Brassica napus]|uniref:ATP-dependent DNA helicase n=1 Tax=Brassica napus TaxID=3708 RepID=A0ABQ8ARL9_BRANA|nr:hypothetical protein HID58_057615 [Brassica napus]
MKYTCRKQSSHSEDSIVTQRKHPSINVMQALIPLRLSYATTVNKIQGKSLKQVALYLPRRVFSHNQIYVALSRVISREGLKIRNKLAGGDNKLDRHQ